MKNPKECGRIETCIKLKDELYQLFKPYKFNSLEDYSQDFALSLLSPNFFFKGLNSTFLKIFQHLQIEFDATFLGFTLESIFTIFHSGNIVIASPSKLHTRLYSTHDCSPRLENHENSITSYPFGSTTYQLIRPEIPIVAKFTLVWKNKNSPCFPGSPPDLGSEIFLLHLLLYNKNRQFRFYHLAFDGDASRIFTSEAPSSPTECKGYPRIRAFSQSRSKVLRLPVELYDSDQFSNSSLEVIPTPLLSRNRISHPGQWRHFLDSNVTSLICHKSVPASRFLPLN